MPHSSTPTAASTIQRFPGLDGLRTILALVVVIVHIQGMQPFFPALNFSGTAFTNRLGYEAVQCFFVLSGFLITYLLLHEQSQTGQISIRKFYWKRVLRIWPLYYTITLVSFFVLPELLDLSLFPGKMQSFDSKTWWLYILILPNLALTLYPGVVGGSQTWSIAIEEQFYLFWPWLVRASRQYLPWVLLSCILCKPFLVEAAGLGIPQLQIRGIVQSPKLYSIITYAHLMWKLFPFEALAWGGLFAWFVQTSKSRVLEVVGHPICQLVSWGLLVVWLAVPVPPLHAWHYQLPIAGLLYGLVIWNIGANPRSMVTLRAPWLNHFGIYSYGIYMWHPVVIYLTLSVFHALGLFTSWPVELLQVVLYATVLSLTLLTAQASYWWLESPFLQLKDRWFGQTATATCTEPTVIPVTPASTVVPNSSNLRRKSSALVESLH